MIQVHNPILVNMQEHIKCFSANIIGSVFFYSKIVFVADFLRRKVSKNARLMVIFYHKVERPLNGDGYLCVTPRNFEKHINYLKENFNIISLQDFLDILEKKSFPEKDSVMITFDDGFEDNYLNAFPILKKHNIPATIFVATDFIGKEGMLKEYQIREMFEHGISFGAHTQKHVRLSKVEIEEARKEILESKRKIESIIKRPVESFCYPYGHEGDFNYELSEVVKDAGFSCAFTALKNGSVFSTSRFLLPRLGIANFSLPAFVSKIEGIFDSLHNLGTIIRNGKNGNGKRTSS